MGNIQQGNTMTTERFDAIVIGAGQAGSGLAARCSKEGLRTAVIERGHFGGTCVNVGCIPTKTVVSRAMHIHPTVSELLQTLLQQLKPLSA
jgi:flavin-dependent dehydrogenase